MISDRCSTSRTGGATGRPLPRSLRGEMESVFGADFTRVRIHESARVHALHTVACTRGADIYFAPGAFDPGSQAGRELLVHELAHVLQQRFGGNEQLSWEAAPTGAASPQAKEGVTA